MTTSEMWGVVGRWATSQYELVMAAARFAFEGILIADGSPTAAHWLAAAAQVETCTAREWIRVGTCLQLLDASAEALRTGEISYAKARTLTRYATLDNEAELLALARTTPASDLGRAIAAWRTGRVDPDRLAAEQHARRGLTTRVDGDGTVVATLRLAPLDAGTLSAAVDAWIMRHRPGREPDGGWPTLAHQGADAITALLTAGGAGTLTEVILHVRGDGCTLDDGTPIPSSVVERIAPTSFLRALIHDAAGRPVNASTRRRHPTNRQKRVVHERHRGACVDCGGRRLLEYDHTPAYAITGRTTTDELTVRCAPCHRTRHRHQS